ncbi:MAG: UDP-N-acetylglucosamine diphosphorylase [Candidatus Methylacidiphilales bacterium]
MTAPTAEEFFDLSDYPCRDLFQPGTPVWEALKGISTYLESRSLTGSHARSLGQPVIRGEVYIGEGSRIDPGVYIEGPVWIGRNTHIRHGAYLRGHVVVGDGCVLGNSCEFKNCILLNEVQVPHFSYVGDSILGNKAHLGAGVICSNLRTDQEEIRVEWGGQRWSTGLKKLGAIAGDGVEVGCQTVLNPGTLLGPRSWLHPGIVWGGSCPPDSRITNRNILKWR